jgi:hypothetical protein
MKHVCVTASVILCLVALTSCTTGSDQNPNPNNPILYVSPPSLDFHGTETLKTLHIMNEGSGALTWSIESEAGWIICAVYSGETETAATVDVCINGKEIDDPDQVHEGVVTVTSNGGNDEVAVSYIPVFTLTGTVYERNIPDIVPLPGATVTLYSGSSHYAATSDQEGAYILADVPKAFDYVEVIKSGYTTSVIASGTKLVIPDNNILVYDFHLAPLSDE